MELALYWFALVLVKALQALPLAWVARFGRGCGAVAYWVDVRHRRTALRNLTLCFREEKTEAEIKALAREHFRRLGENYCCAIKTAAMTWGELEPFVEFARTERLGLGAVETGPHSWIVAIGHFGNFELYARMGQFTPGVQCATTYRSLKQASLNRLMQSLRERSGCRFFERRTDGAALKAALAENSLLLGLLADQHAGDGGIRVPFFNRDCSTSAAPAVLALRYHCPLFTGFCYRVGLGRWRIEAGPSIPTHENNRPRSVEAISLDINKAFEAAVRVDPANWFWVHNRWKPAKSRKKRPPPVEHEGTREPKPVEIP
jgi:KDO2-lipid IV(A) lauroyltransferase